MEPVTQGARTRPPPAQLSWTPDATTFLTGYVVLLVAIPARLTFAPLGAAGTPAQLLGIAGAGWWAWSLVAKRVRLSLPSPLRAATAAFCACVLVSFVKATMRPIDATELRAAQMALLSVTSWVGVFLVAHDGITDRDRLQTLVRRLAGAGGLLAVFGLVQFVTGHTYTGFISLPGLTANLPLYGLADRNGLARPAATALSPIEFGVFLTICLPLAVHLALTDGQRPIRRWLTVFAIAAAIPLSISRSAIVGTVVVLAFLLPTWSRSRRHRAYVGIVGLLMSVFVLVPGLLGSILKLFTQVGNDASAQSRTDSYPLAWEFISRAPLFGRGFFTFLPKYRILDNQYLGLLIEIGIVGLVSVLVLFVSGVLTGLRYRRRASVDTRDRDLALCVSAALAAAGASLAFFDAFSFPLVTGFVFLLLGCLGTLVRTGVPGTQLRSLRPAPTRAAVQRPAVTPSGAGRAPALPRSRAVVAAAGALVITAIAGTTLLSVLAVVHHRSDQAVMPVLLPNAAEAPGTPPAGPATAQSAPAPQDEVPEQAVRRAQAEVEQLVTEFTQSTDVPLRRRLVARIKELAAVPGVTVPNH